MTRIVENAWGPYLCKCRIYFKYDADLVVGERDMTLSDGKNVGNHGERLPGHDPIGTRLVKCQAHESLTEDDTYAAAFEEDERLKSTLRTILDTLNYDPVTFAKDLSPQYVHVMAGDVPRTLHIHTAGTTDAAERAAIMAACDVRFGVGKVFVDG